MGDLPHRVPNDPRYFTADVHITPDGRARIGGHDYTPAEYADMLRRSGYDGSRPVRLIGCDAGSNDFAQQLSRHLDAPVLAPTKPAWTDVNGRVFTSDVEVHPDGTRQPRIPPDGQWETHHPDGSRTRTGDDGYAPDTQRHDGTDADGAQDRAARPGDRETPTHQDIDWREPEFDQSHPRTVNPGEPFYDPPRHTPDLEPRTRYEVTDANGRQTHVYTDGSNPPRVIAIDAHTSNTRTGYDGRVDNPDASFTQPDVDYRVHAGGEPFTFHTDPNGNPQFDIDNFNAPNGPEYQPGGANYRTETYDPSGPPFSRRTDLEPDRRYHVTNSATGEWHGDFYTSPELTADGRSQFTHVETWTDKNPELGDANTRRAVDVRPTDGLPLPETRYQVDDRSFHTNSYGAGTVSYPPDYSPQNHPPRYGGVQTPVGKMGEYDVPTGGGYRGGHTQAHAEGGINEALGVVPQKWNENNIRLPEKDPTSPYENSWARAEKDRLEAHTKQNEDVTRVRVFPSQESTGLTPERVYWIDQRVHPVTGQPVVHYRSHDNV